jgi:hypothetical protein
MASKKRSASKRRKSGYYNQKRSHIHSVSQHLQHNIIQGPSSTKQHFSRLRQEWQVFWHWSYPLRTWEYRFAKRARVHLNKFFDAIIVTLGLSLIGLNVPANTLPFIQYWPWSLIPTLLFFFYFLRLCFLSPSPPAPTRFQLAGSMFPHFRHYLSITFHAVAILTFLFSLTTVALVHTRPAWCPSALCPPAPKAPFNDGTLAITLANRPQTPFYVYLPSQPTTDSPSTAVGAAYADGKLTPNHYHIVLGLQNLHKDIGLTIESIDIFITQIQALPSHPLRVWANANQFVNSSPNLYVGQYSGQLAGELIPTKYERFQGRPGFVHLDPQEMDQIDVQVISQREVNMSFRVRITYRMDNQPDLRILSFPSSFQVAFATAADWRVCNLETYSCL